MSAQNPTPEEIRMNQIFQDVQLEVNRAMQKHPKFPTIHHGYAVLLEEVDELWEAVKLQDVNKHHLREEAIQIAAMAIRFINDVAA